VCMGVNLLSIEKKEELTLAQWNKNVDWLIGTGMMQVSQARDEFKRAVFRELREEAYSDFKAIYTDGSKTNNACGFAAVTEDSVLFKTRTRNSASIYTAEIRALMIEGDRRNSIYGKTTRYLYGLPKLTTGCQ
jgi:hypothetical protein